MISNGHECLEPGPLASTELLSHRHHLQNLVLEGYPQEKSSDLRFLVGEEEETDLLQGLDQVAHLGGRDPLLVLSLAYASSAALASAPLRDPP